LQRRFSNVYGSQNDRFSNQTEGGHPMQPRLEAPAEPVISRNESNAACRLMMQIAFNLLEHGDVQDDVFELLHNFAWGVNELNVHSTGEHADALYAAIESALLPTFHNGSSPEVAGAALYRLIAVNAKLRAEGGH
jgi:hypothetical protein